VYLSPGCIRDFAVGLKFTESVHRLFSFYTPIGMTSLRTRQFES
jgi:hypothetical protein